MAELFSLKPNDDKAKTKPLYDLKVSDDNTHESADFCSKQQYLQIYSQWGI